MVTFCTLGGVGVQGTVPFRSVHSLVRKFDPKGRKRTSNHCTWSARGQLKCLQCIVDPDPRLVWKRLPKAVSMAAGVKQSEQNERGTIWAVAVRLSFIFPVCLKYLHRQKVENFKRDRDRSTRTREEKEMAGPLHPRFLLGQDHPGGGGLLRSSPGATGGAFPALHLPRPSCEQPQEWKQHPLPPPTKAGKWKPRRAGLSRACTATSWRKGFLHLHAGPCGVGLHCRSLAPSQGSARPSAVTLGAR